MGSVMSQFGDESLRGGTAPFQEGLCEKRAASGRETLASKAAGAAPLPRLYSYRKRAIPRERSSARRTDVVAAPLRPRRASPAADSRTHQETAISGAPKSRRKRIAAEQYTTASYDEALQKMYSDRLTRFYRNYDEAKVASVPKPCGNQNQPVARANAPA